MEYTEHMWRRAACWLPGRRVRSYFGPGENLPSPTGIPTLMSDILRPTPELDLEGRGEGVEVKSVRVKEVGGMREEE